MQETRPETKKMDFFRAVSLWREMLSYETLWAIKDQTQKKLAGLFQQYAGLPSRVLEEQRLLARQGNLFRDLEGLEEDIESYLRTLGGHFAVSVHGTFQYPSRLRDSAYPLELFYYRGDIGFLENKAVSVVGARKCSPDGAKRAAKMARGLAAADYTVVSGLATGIDTAAMRGAIDAGGRTVGVIGTPINETYPKQNAALQEQIATEHLLVSQVPFYRYKIEPFASKRRYFPERNVTMAALSLATVIIEASETSGSHTQARACLAQGRTLFILNSCFESGLKWPHTYLKQGAIRVRDMDEVLSVLGTANNGGQDRNCDVDEV